MSDISPAKKRDFYAIITNPTADKLLLISGETGWTLPHWQAEKAITHNELTAWAMQSVQDLTGLQAFLLKEYYFERLFDEAGDFRGTHRVMTFEARQEQAVENGRWCSRTEIAAGTIENPLHARLVDSWWRETVDSPAPANRMAWAQPGWFDKTSQWVREFVAKQGWQTTGEIELSKSNVISAQLKILTSVGYLYLKAVPHYFKSEPVFSKLLEKLLPLKVPRILATEPDNGWILMADFKGQPLAEQTDFTLWEAALKEYARLQIECIQHTGELLAAGVRDRRLAILGGQLEQVFSRTDLWRMGQPMGLTEVEVKGLPTLVPRLQAMIKQLTAYGLPETIDSGDFHPFNIAVTEKGFVFYDWSDLTITHPFFSLNPFVEYIEEGAEAEQRWESLVNAYLEPWQRYLPLEKLREAYKLAFALGSAVQVLNYSWIYDNIEPADYSNVDFALLHYTRMLLKAIQT